MVFLALGEHRDEAVFGRKDFAAEQDGFDRVRARKVAGHANVWHQVLGGGDANRQFRKRLNPLALEQHHQIALDYGVQLCRPWVG